MQKFRARKEKIRKTNVNIFFSCFFIVSINPFKGLIIALDYLSHQPHSLSMGSDGTPRLTTRQPLPPVSATAARRPAAPDQLPGWLIWPFKRVLWGNFLWN